MVLWLDHQPIKQIHTQKLSDDPPSVWSMPSGDSQLDSIIPPRVLTHCHTGSHMHGAHHTDSHVLSHALPHTAHTLTHSPHTMHTHVPACGAHSSIRSHVRHTHHTRLHTHAHTQNTHVLLQGTDVALHINSREPTAWRFCRVPLFTNASPSQKVYFALCGPRPSLGL